MTIKACFEKNRFIWEFIIVTLLMPVFLSFFFGWFILKLKNHSIDVISFLAACSMLYVYCSSIIKRDFTFSWRMIQAGVLGAPYIAHSCFSFSQTT